MTETIKAHIEEVNSFQTDNKEQLEAFRIKYLGSKGLMKDFFAEFKCFSRIQIRIQIRNRES